MLRRAARPRVTADLAALIERRPEKRDRTRANEVLALNIEDLDSKRGRITGKGGTIRWIHWQSGTARLLPRLIGGRTSGPLFLADRRPAPARTLAAAGLRTQQPSQVTP
jgi:integrase